MNSLTTLFRLIQTTRAQVQYGYILAEIPKSEISDLAQHHYLVSFVAWQLARLAIRSGAKLDMGKVLEYCLIHDLGELFGGDISMPYAKANPIAKEKAKEFEMENQRYLAKFFGDDQEHFQELSDEIMDAKNDEALIAKLADYIEVTHYRLYVRNINLNSVVMASGKLASKIEQMHDPVAKRVLSEFIEQWLSEMGEGKFEEFFEKDMLK